jgi:thioredoxin 1
MLGTIAANSHCQSSATLPIILEVLTLVALSVLAQFKLNTDESPGVATEYGIRSIPTVMIFKNGSKMDTVIGAVPKETLVQTLEKYMDS